MPRVGEAELAKALRRNRTAIRRAKLSGRITEGPDGLYDLETAIEEWHATTHHEKGHINRRGKSGAPKQAEFSGALPEIPAPEIPAQQETRTTAYAKARASTQIYEALLKKLRYEERARSLTPTADVENARFIEFRTLREACFNIPSRIAALLAGESNVARCQQMLEDEIRNIFDAYAEGKQAA